MGSVNFIYIQFSKWRVIGHKILRKIHRPYDKLDFLVT